MLKVNQLSGFGKKAVADGGGGGGGSILFVQEKTSIAHAGDTGAVSFDTPLIAGNSVIACVTYDPACAPVFLIQVGSEPLAQVVAENSADVYSEIWVLHNVTGGETNFQFIGSDAGQMEINIQEWSGLGTADAEDTNSNVGASSNTVDSGTATPISVDNLIIAVGSWPTDDYYSSGPTNSFQRLTRLHESGKAGQEAAYLIQAAATAKSTGWGLSNSVNWASVIAAFGTADISFDSDALAFFTAAGITDPTIKTAVNQLVLDLKSASIWTKLTAIYPFAGGVDTAHAVNLKTPGTFDITWHGGITHDATGVTSNGTTGYGDSGLNPSTDIPANEGSMGIWVDATTGANKIEIGSSSGGATLNEIVVHWSDNSYYVSIGGDQAFGTYGGGGETLYQVVRTDSTNCFFRVGTAAKIDFTGAYSAPNLNNFILCGNNSGTPSFFSNRPNKFAYFGTTLTNTEAGALATAVAAYQTAMGR